MLGNKKFAVCCVAFCLFAGQALDAHSLVPVATNFQISGKVTLGATKHENCDIEMVGATSPSGTKGDAAEITGVTVKSKTRQCETLSFTSFPYSVIIDSHAGGNIENLTILIKGSSCQFSSIPLTVSKKGLWDLYIVGACDFFGSLRSIPTVTIGK